jgi:hypothetical protein
MVTDYLYKATSLIASHPLLLSKIKSKEFKLIICGLYGFNSGRFNTILCAKNGIAIREDPVNKNQKSMRNRNILEMTTTYHNLPSK